MKSCLHCKYAGWRRTDSGKLHPSGDGRCTYDWKMPPLPQSMYWLGKIAPTMPYIVTISRKKELPDHCAYWTEDKP